MMLNGPGRRNFIYVQILMIITIMLHGAWSMAGMNQDGQLGKIQGLKRAQKLWSEAQQNQSSYWSLVKSTPQLIKVMSEFIQKEKLNFHPRDVQSDRFAQMVKAFDVFQNIYSLLGDGLYQVYCLPHYAMSSTMDSLADYTGKFEEFRGIYLQADFERITADLPWMPLKILAAHLVPIVGRYIEKFHRQLQNYFRDFEKYEQKKRPQKKQNSRGLH